MSETTNQTSVNMLDSWISETLGTYDAISQFAHDHEYSELWRLHISSAGNTDRYVWLKCHRYPGKWAGEVNALANWVPSLNLSAPRLLAYRDRPNAVLLSELSGKSAHTIGLERKAEETLWFSAGEWLRTLHQHENEWFGAVLPDGSPQGATHTDAEAFVRKSLNSRRQQGTEQSLFDKAELAFLEEAIEYWPTALKGETPRAIHRDFSPRNWITDEEGRLQGVIDFEHSRWDVRAADLNRWWDTDFLTKVYLIDAFFDGYLGGLPDEILLAQIRVMRLLGAVAGVVWATQVGDHAYATVNRQALHRLMQQSPL